MLATLLYIFKIFPLQLLRCRTGPSISMVYTNIVTVLPNILFSFLIHITKFYILIILVVSMNFRILFVIHSEYYGKNHVEEDETNEHNECPKKYTCLHRTDFTHYKYHVKSARKYLLLVKEKNAFRIVMFYSLS